MHRGTLGSHWDPCLETGLWEEGLDSQWNLPPQSQPPRVAASPFSPPRVEFGPRGALEVASLEKFLPFPRRLRGLGSRSSGAPLPGR